MTEPLDKKKECFCGEEEVFRPICSECNNKHKKVECIRQNNVGLLRWYCPICKKEFECGTMETTNKMFCEGGLK